MATPHPTPPHSCGFLPICFYRQPIAIIDSHVHFIIIGLVCPIIIVVVVVDYFGFQVITTLAISYFHVIECLAQLYRRDYQCFCSLHH